VTVGRNVQAVRLSGNSIHDNGWLGIDLIPTGYGYGVTPNDPLDVDTGGNGLQNFPDVLAVTREGSAVRVMGMLQSSPLGAFTVELFASPVCEPGGFGEGQTFLGSTSVTTDASGSASFDVLLAATVPTGSLVTATATLELLGATSEHSACVALSEQVHCQANVGYGGPGAGLLSLCGGDLSSGTTADLWLQGAAPGQVAFLAVGPTFTPTPVFGGTFVPLPPVVVVPLVTDASGAIGLPNLTGGGGPVSTYVQYLVLDAAQPQGIGFSNALRVDFLP
jgi:hypothetical protein